MSDIKLMQGDCIKLMKSMPNRSVDFTLTDIPYGEVNRKDNGLRNLNKHKADMPTFNLDVFLNEIDRVTKGTVVIFCGIEQVSEIANFFANKQKNKKEL